MNPSLLSFFAGVLAGGALAGIGEAKNRRTLNRLRRGKTGRLSIVIASRNEEAVIENTIRTLAASAPQDAEIVVVDGSTDSTPQILARLAGEIPNLKVLSDPYRAGKPAALNYALRHVTGEIVLFLDADARMDQEGLRFYPEVLAGSNLDAVSADLVPYNARRTWAVEVQEYFSSFGRRLICSGLFWWPTFVTCGLFVRKETLDKAGEFDPKTLVDDFDLGIRLAKMGIKVPFVQGPRCFIQHAPTLRDLFYQHLRWYTGGIQRTKEEIKNGDLSYLLLMAALGLVIYFPQLALLVDGVRSEWVLVPFVLPGFLGLLWGAAQIAYLLDRPKAKGPFFWAFPFVYFWIQFTAAISFFRSFRREMRWYKVQREKA